MDFVASSGWLERFKARHNIVFRNLHGEAKDVPESLCEEWRIRLPTLLFGYKASDVFNIDETGLFYKCVPQKTLMFKGESCAGGKMSKDRLTVLVGANADGSEKLPLLVIGKSKNPRCFKNVKSLPVNYKSNKKSWMTSELFEEYVRKLDLSFHKKSREVLLFVDNCPAHPKLKNLKSIKLEFFPPNTTAKLQPADQGVIRNLKVHYRKRVIRKLINDIENNKEHTSSISVLDALRMVFSAWQNDVSQDTIAHCFQKCGFFPSSAPNIVDEVNECLDNEFRDVFQEQSLELSDFVNVDSELITCDELCDEDIIAEVTAKEDGTDNEEKIEISEHNDLPTNADVSNALSIIHRSIESRENVPQDIFNAMSKINDFIHSRNINSKNMSDSSDDEPNPKRRRGVVHEEKYKRKITWNAMLTGLQYVSYKGKEVPSKVPLNDDFYRNNVMITKEAAIQLEKEGKAMANNVTCGCKPVR
ncbi:tigger transposable element-derived protein 4-like [Uloborus diversus]|uniref:tigger transposable element-derived protein 4-like n=1 Tax=Uloborus diversus TaxID=327109 RepID=UPI002408F44F|nr:tigger transposable element-derived protein 4-like [Uloborus diversus]